MKNLKRLSIIAITLLSVTLVSCSKSDNQAVPDLTKEVIGTYQGDLTTNNLKSTSPAQADITAVNSYTIEVHCYGDDIDTTFMLELYENGNMMNVCFTDGDFYNEYGHNMSENHHMMGDNGSWTNWSQHMSNNHSEGDEHYGYFNMTEGQFDYTFNVETTGGNTYTQKFSGIQQ